MEKVEIDFKIAMYWCGWPRKLFVVPGLPVKQLNLLISYVIKIIIILVRKATRQAFDFQNKRISHCMESIKNAKFT